MLIGNANSAASTAQANVGLTAFQIAVVQAKVFEKTLEEVSDRAMEIMREFSDKFEQVSIDEAYLDISEKCSGNFHEARELAEKIKKRIFDEEKFTCSVGIGPNKLIAKMASGVKKPNGLTIVTQAEVRTFLRAKKISDLHGIGEKTFEVLKENGITNIP